MNSSFIYFLIGYKVYKEEYINFTIERNLGEQKNWSNFTLDFTLQKEVRQYELIKHFLTISSRTYVLKNKQTGSTFYLEYASEEKNKVENLLILKSLIKFFKKRF